MSIDELRLKAKEMGITQATNMKEETLIKKMAELSNKPEATKIAIEVSDQDKEFLNSIGFKDEWLYSLANRYNFNRFQYATKFKAFRCYLDNNHIDWISVNDLGLLNVSKELTPILLKHQNHNPDKQVIKLGWRK